MDWHDVRTASKGSVQGIAARIRLAAASLNVMDVWPNFVGGHAKIGNGSIFKGGTPERLIAYIGEKVRHIRGQAGHAFSHG